ncbi:TonB-dependent siderophore receptor [Sulfitobacter sp. S0837]|uniref:TonB-dependent siderophore receptor n=1 Tax=Sulfitobacter maritimus TaxID=2741719 RepID=UPI001583892F|nr:TonB-dependent siderophore receptor [Sulfitobacter maritimus]NUH67138.1 TonB-dependent siderophore receptor [Sulfitobacter maritimus]
MPLSPTLSRHFGHSPLRTALMCCTALVPGVLSAQEAYQLDDVILQASARTSGASDAQTVVASELSSGGKLSGEIINIPASVSVITSREIEARGADSVEQVLNYTAGASTDSYGADDRFDYFILRGFEAYTYRDGLTLGANFGAVREEPFAFERVEVIKGASSATFGLSDPGGSVNYVTKRPRAERFGSVYTSLDSYGSVETGVDFGDTLDEEGTLSYRFTGLMRDGELEYPTAENDEAFAMGGLTWRPSDASELTVIIDHLNRDSVPGSGGFPSGGDYSREDVFYGEPDYNYRGTERTTVSVLGAHDFGGGLSFEGSLRYSDSADDFGYAYVSDYSPNDTTVDRAYFASDGTAESFISDLHLTYEGFVGGAASTTTAGVEFSWSDESDQRFYGAAPSVDIDNPTPTGRPISVPMYADLDTETEGKALYLQQMFNWNEQIIASFGLRHDWIDVTETNNLAATVQSGEISETTGRFGLTYKITPNIAVFGNYAQSAVPAGLGVEPEEGEQFELGGKWQPMGSNALLTASVYDLSKSNITRTNPATNQPETIGEIGVRGIDLEAKAEVGAYTFTGAYSYLDAEIKENGTSGNVGNRPGLVPEHIASIWASRTWENLGRGDLTVGLGARFNGGYYYSDTNASGETGSFVVVDAAVNYDLTERTALSASVTNLFDEKHTAYGGSYADFYSPGREVTVKLSHSW